MTISPWFLLFFSVPVLWLGEQAVKRVKFLNKYNIPAPVVGGLAVSLGFLFIEAMGISVQLRTEVGQVAWRWIITADSQLKDNASVNVAQPFLVAFFACIGLNASWGLARKAGRQLLIFLALCGLLTAIQNGVGITLATLLGDSPILGLLCGSVTLTGGHGTALGFADTLVKAGYTAAPVVGVAAATFGLVSGGLLGGPIGSLLIRRHKLVYPNQQRVKNDSRQDSTENPSGFFTDLRRLWLGGMNVTKHLIVLLVCLKLGAWVSLFIREMGITFPVYIGAMIVGLVLRNIADISGTYSFSTGIFDTLGSVCLGVFLSTAMMSLDLMELSGSISTMLLILAVQVTLMGFYAYLLTYNLLGKDYDAAVMAAGHCGFGLGATPTAVANMKSIVDGYGAAPRAFLVLPIVGAFLIDFVNALVITTYLNLIT